MKKIPTRAYKLPSGLFEPSLQRKARETNYSQDVLHMTYEEIESIPCITEREVN